MGESTRYPNCSMGERHALETLDHMADEIIANCGEVSHWGRGVPFEWALEHLRDEISAKTLAARIGN